MSKTKHTVKEGNHPHTSMIPKAAMARKRETSNVQYGKCILKLRNQELKTMYIYRMLYQSIMVNANCNSTVDNKKGTATQTTLKLEIKSQEKRTKAERRKKTYKHKSKTI